MADYQADNPFENDSGTNPFEEDKGENVNAPPMPRKDTSKKNAPELPQKGTNYYQADIQRKEQVIGSMNLPFELTPEGIKKKELELKRREEDLQRREQAMLDKEEELDKISPKKKNWPRFRPMIYHNIQEEIPEAHRKLVRNAYIIWFVTVWCYFYNFFSVLSALIVSGGGSEIASFILSIVDFIFFVPLSFMIYRLLYRATRKGKSSLYFSYMILLWIEYIWFGWQGVGIRGWGGGGIFLMLALFQAKQTVVAIFCLVCTVFWAILIVLHFYLFIHARINYKAAGGFKATKQQAASAAVEVARDNPELAMEGIKIAAKTSATAAKQTA